MNKEVILVLGIFMVLSFVSGCKNQEATIQHEIQNLHSQDTDSADKSIKNLVHIGEPTIPYLVEELDETRRFTTMRVVQVLEQLGPKGIDALRERHIGCTNDTLRITLTLELIRITQNKEYIPGVADILTSAQPVARAKAGTFVGRLMNTYVAVTLSQEEGATIKEHFKVWWNSNQQKLQWNSTEKVFHIVD